MHRKLWVKLDRLAVVRNGAIKITLRLIRNSAVVERQYKLGIESSRLAVIRDRAVEIALGPIGEGYGS